MKESKIEETFWEGKNLTRELDGEENSDNLDRGGGIPRSGSCVSVVLSFLTHRQRRDIGSV